MLWNGSKVLWFGKRKSQKNNTRDSNVVPHRSTNLARQCLTSLSRREAVLSLWYGRSWWRRLIYNMWISFFWEEDERWKHRGGTTPVTTMKDESSWIGRRVPYHINPTFYRNPINVMTNDTPPLAPASSHLQRKAAQQKGKYPAVPSSFGLHHHGWNQFHPKPPVHKDSVEQSLANEWGQLAQGAK